MVKRRSIKFIIKKILQKNVSNDVAPLSDVEKSLLKRRILIEIEKKSFI